MEEKVLSILKTIRPEFDFETSDNFIDDGYLDSFDVVTLVSEFEQTFNCTISGMDVLPENFETIEKICEFIRQSSGGAM